jgi:hypothetical protein
MTTASELDKVIAFSFFICFFLSSLSNSFF